MSVTTNTEFLKDALKTEQDETARLRRQIEAILEIADTYGRRIETAMDGCDKIAALCVPALPALADKQSATNEYRPLFGLSKPEQDWDTR